MPGPVPKRSDQRRRSNKDPMGVSKLPVSNPLVECPPVDESWHRLAKDWYLSLIESGQSFYYAASDWAHAVLVADLLSRELSAADEGGKPRAMMLQTIFSEMGNLMTTEGARRRLRLELERAKAEDEKADAEVHSIMAQYAGRV